jgi:hypothetical protein
MKRLLTKVIQKSLNALMGGASLPLNPNHAIAIEGQKEMTIEKQPKTRIKELPWGKGSIEYRIPNAIEQLRFQSAAKWYDEKISMDGALRLSYAIEAIPPFIVSIKGEYQTWDDVIAERGNSDVLSDIALDLAGKRVPEPEKKP